MPHRPERLRPATWTGPERGFRPPTPFPGFEDPGFRRRYYSMLPPDSLAQRRYTDATRYRYGDELERYRNEQNDKIRRRSLREQGRYYKLERFIPKRVRFSLPPPQRKDELDEFTREFAKLSIRDKYAGPGRRRCSRCGQKLQSERNGL